MGVYSILSYHLSGLVHRSGTAEHVCMCRSVRENIMPRSNSCCVLSAIIRPGCMLCASLQRFAHIPEIFAECARSTSAFFYHIIFSRLHFGLEAVSSNDLVRMRASDNSRVDQRIQTFDRKLRTCEAHHRCAATDILSACRAC
jgi:hypothetical protein